MTNTNLDFKLVIGATGVAVHDPMFAPSYFHNGEVLARPVCRALFEKEYRGMRDNVKVSHRVSEKLETTCKKCLAAR